MDLVNWYTETTKATQPIPGATPTIPYGPVPATPGLNDTDKAAIDRVYQLAMAGDFESGAKLRMLIDAADVPTEVQDYTYGLYLEYMKSQEALLQPTTALEGYATEEQAQAAAGWNQEVYPLPDRSWGVRNIVKKPTPSGYATEEQAQANALSNQTVIEGPDGLFYPVTAAPTPSGPNIDTYTDKGTGEIVAIDMTTGKEVWRVSQGVAPPVEEKGPQWRPGELERLTTQDEAQQRQWLWQKAWTQLQGSREQQLREAELAQTREQYLAGLQAAPRSWIKYWQAMHPPTYREPDEQDTSGFIEGLTAQQVYGRPAAIPGSVAGARMAAPTQAPGGSWMPNANPLPPVPEWMRNIPVSYSNFKVPSTQQWRRMLPSEQQGYFGLTDYLGKPEMDVIGQMRNLWPQWASKRGVAMPAYQRR